MSKLLETIKAEDVGMTTPEYAQMCCLGYFIVLDSVRDAIMQCGIGYCIVSEKHRWFVDRRVIEGDDVLVTAGGGYQ